MDGLKVERKIERGERRGTRVGTLAAAVRDTLGVEGGARTARSHALFLAQLSEVISEGRVIHGGHNWIVKRVRRCRRFQRLGTMFPQSKNSLLVEVLRFLPRAVRICACFEHTFCGVGCFPQPTDLTLL